MFLFIAKTKHRSGDKENCVPTQARWKKNKTTWQDNMHCHKFHAFKSNVKQTITIIHANPSSLLHSWMFMKTGNQLFRWCVSCVILPWKRRQLAQYKVDTLLCVISTSFSRDLISSATGTAKSTGASCTRGGQPRNCWTVGDVRNMTLLLVAVRLYSFLWRPLNHECLLKHWPSMSYDSTDANN